MVPPDFLKQSQIRWDELLNGNQGEKIKKIFALDGKTQRGDKRGGQKPNHIISAVDENGFCFSQCVVDEKTNESKAFPGLLNDINIKGHIVTVDAAGCYKDIAKEITGKKADYVLALKGNQGTLHGDARLYFDDPELPAGCAYTRTAEKARSSIEIREYWQTGDISWMPQKKGWPKLKSIAMTRNTIKKDDKTTVETRYFMSSLATTMDEDGKETADEIARAIRSHWMVEGHHHHLDVTFKEDANQTADKAASVNLNIVTKLAHGVLKLLDVGRKNVSIKAKRFMACLNPEKYIDMILEG